jgi:DNA (cytosine-5)-methyltransferase 1
MDTITAVDHHSLVAAHLVKFYGTSTGHPIQEPLATVTSGGWKHGLVAAFLARYHGKGEAESLQLPLGGLTTRDRYALVTVTDRRRGVRHRRHRHADAHAARALPRQGFPDDYQIAPTWNGKPLTKTAQVRMCGNSVCPPIAAAVVRRSWRQRDRHRRDNVGGAHVVRATALINRLNDLVALGLVERRKAGKSLEWRRL